jgi:hypothetical protein
MARSPRGSPRRRHGSLHLHARRRARRRLAVERSSTLPVSPAGSGSNVVADVAQDGSNTIAITADVGDLAALGALLSSPSPEVAVAMEAHGVVQPIVVYVEA